MFPTYTCYLNSFQWIDYFFHFQVREMVSECQCPTQFPMIRVSEGKYRIGDTKVLIFVRVSFSLQLLEVMDSERARPSNYSTLPHLTRKMMSN